MVVLTGSMQPALPVGSVVFVEKDNWYFLGDVVSFKNKANLTVTHRIVDKVQKEDGLYYQVKGDANNSPDSELVAAKNVLGKRIFHLPYIGKLAIFLRTLPGFIVLIILPALIFIAFELWSLKKEIERQTEKKLLEQLATT